MCLDHPEGRQLGILVGIFAVEGAKLLAGFADEFVLQARNKGDMVSFEIYGG